MKPDNWFELILLTVKIKTPRLLLFINFCYSWLVLCWFLNFYHASHKRWHCVKRAFIRSYSGPESIRSYYPTFELNIQSKHRKIRTKITPNTDTLHAMCLTYNSTIREKHFRWNCELWDQSNNEQIYRYFVFVSSILCCWERFAYKQVNKKSFVYSLDFKLLWLLH